MASSTGYSSQTSINSPAVGGGSSVDGGGDSDGIWTLEQCIDSYLTYLMSKRLEIEEQQEARRYRHGAQWTVEQVKILNDRKQPVVTYNRLGRKIDGIVGLVEKLRQDPKAYPRTPEHQEGADLATAVLRYIMDTNHWQDVKSIVAEKAAVDGLGGIEFDLKLNPPDTEQGEGTGPPGQPDYDVSFGPVDNDGFFYDPRSYKHDFSDARYIGIGKWVDRELLKEMMPDKAEEIDSDSDTQNSSYLSSDSDRDIRWFNSTGKIHQVRLVDVWYKSKGKWRWALFTRGAILKEGESPFYDQDGQQICKYQMFSAQVDHEGDRYGFPRNLKSAQDEVNQRRSKGLHLNNSRRLITTAAAIADNDVEKLRREWARSDGIVISSSNNIDDIRPDDAGKQAQLMAELEFLKEAKAEIENFGPNPALLGNAGVGQSSGKAIALMQQAGVAELGPYMLNLRAWTLRVYRALFQAAQKYWTNERWIRVTDNQGLEQFVKLNQMQFGQDGTAQMVNVIGSLDVDIILDEGPDTITMMADTYEAISQALPSVAKILSPPQAQAVMEVLIETSPLPADVKKKFRDAGQQAQQQGPPPEVQAKMAELQLEQQKNQGQLQLKQQMAQVDAQTKQQTAAADIQIEREKAQNQMALEREKFIQQAQLEREKMLSGHDMALKQAEFDNGLAQDKAQRDEQMAQRNHEAELTRNPPKPPAPDHTPAMLEVLNRLASRKTPIGMKRTPQGMQVVFDQEP